MNKILRINHSIGIVNIMPDLFHNVPQNIRMHFGEGDFAGQNTSLFDLAFYTFGPIIRFEKHK